MNVSKLLNPMSSTPSEPEGLLTRELSLPPCVVKPRDPSKNFLLDSHGFVHLTRPRRTIPCGMQQCLPPRAEYLFGSHERGSQLSPIRRDLDYQETYSNPSSYPYHNYHTQQWAAHRHAQAVWEQQGRTYASAPTYEIAGAPDFDIYVDMSVDPRAIRTEEEERRVQQYHATMDTMASMYSKSATPSAGPTKREELVLSPMATHEASYANSNAVRATLGPAVWPTAPATNKQLEVDFS